MRVASGAAVVHLPVVGASPGSAPDRLDSLVAVALGEQARLTAVERFAQRHDAGELPNLERYRELWPRDAPGPGQQYAFDVDLDRCSGCKACVAGCHSMNGLDEGEVWRKVGVLHGGTPDAPVQRTVTGACHHCVEPACLAGCPVNAYEKDALTGIVRHLDDQCIGCRYCTLTCPYDVPQFNARLGIVRKCDLCAGRLAEGEPPACVQACPTGAIAVTVVTVDAVVARADAGAFLPGAPPPDLTLPTTSYTSRRALPANALAADFAALRPGDAHLPLAVMLVLTQLSAGSLVAGVVTDATGGAMPAHAAVGALAGLTALGASTLHLGRPARAYRAVIGLRHSWLSREILAFGAFSAAALAHAVAAWATLGLSASAHATLRGVLASAVAVTGFVAVLCSVMVYHVTRRSLWAAPRTAFRFFGTAALLGVASVLVAAVVVPGVGAPTSLAAALAAVAAVKLAWEASLFVHLGSRRHTELKRSALLSKRELGGEVFWRFWCGAVGGLLAPLVLALAASEPSGARVVTVAALASAVLLLAGELLERDLFFRTAAAPRMPGGLP